MSSQFFHIYRSGLKAWLDGISAYKSQIEVLFGTDKKMRVELQGYWLEEKGIRLWEARQ